MDKTLEPAIVPALLRACLAGDETGAAVIVNNSDPLTLIFALCGFINQQCTAYMDGDRGRWDAALAEVQRQMTGR
ncbi:hypothetical protein [Streptomyces sp. NPDC018833]|uniref:hypothetical protein n=1 Tax=Streptomyces sp. NPDC018833 TaxID=3365053 RepID=UPI00379ECF29